MVYRVMTKLATIFTQTLITSSTLTIISLLFLLLMETKTLRGKRTVTSISALSLQYWRTDYQVALNTITERLPTCCLASHWLRLSVIQDIIPISVICQTVELPLSLMVISYVQKTLFGLQISTLQPTVMRLPNFQKSVALWQLTVLMVIVPAVTSSVKANQSTHSTWRNMPVLTKRLVKLFIGKM